MALRLAWWHLAAQRYERLPALLGDGAWRIAGSWMGLQDGKLFPTL